VIHADEACLGNGQDRATPGGCGGLVEIGPPGAVERLDYFLSEPDTTNNRMALRSAIAALDLIAGPGTADLTFVTDSNYIVLGMTRWVGAWRARGWRRKGGAIENLDLWHDLIQRAEGRPIAWRWVRGHAGHAKNEYANALATRAAGAQTASAGLVPSGFPAWLEQERARGRYLAFDPDGDLR
jgi:ribonuclease HI